MKTQSNNTPTLAAFKAQEVKKDAQKEVKGGTIITEDCVDL